MQAECLETWESDANMLISAPTGAGKTFCFELAILRILHRTMGTTAKEKTTSTLKDAIGKIVYIAPTKSLCSERAHDWERKFQNLGLRVKAITGDIPSSSFDSVLGNVDLVVATAEKWDSLTRNLRAKTPSEMSSQIQLLLLDEVHQVGDSRGAVYEAVVSRMLLTHDNSFTLRSTGGRAAPAASLRIIAVSATVANVKDFAMWLRVSDNNTKVFDENYRPVELQYHVLGYSARNPWMFGKVYDRNMLSVVSKYGEGEPSIVFCPSRRQTVISAEALLDKLGCRGSSQAQTNPFLRTLSQGQKSRLASCAEECNNPLLRRLLPESIAIHNADLNARERGLVETMFRERLVRCLFSTSTLAQGVNLPARLVVIAGTTIYNGGCLLEYQRNLLLQMSGRAGRPGLDSKGVVVIMTSLSQVDTYNNINRDASNKVTSQLSESLGEAINAEIARQVVTNLPTAGAFLSNTLLCRQQNPRWNKPASECDSNGENWLHSVAVNCINTLRDANLLQYDSDQFGFSSTLPGTFMAKYCLSVTTMQLLMKAIPTASSPSQILGVVASCSEVQEGVTLRRSERKRLNTMNEWIRMPVRGKIEGLRDKVIVLIQIAIGDVRRISSCDIALRNEARRLLQSASRVSACIIALVLHNAINMRYEAAMAALQLCRGLQNRCLWDGPTLLRQVPGISASDIRALNKAGILSLAKLANLNFKDLEREEVCSPAFTATLEQRMKIFPKFVVRAEASFSHLHEGRVLSVSVDVTISSMCGNERLRQRNVNCFIMIGVPNTMLLKFHMFPLRDGHGSVICTLPIETAFSANGYVDVLVGCDTICGIDVKTRVRPGEGQASQLGPASEPQRIRHTTSVRQGRVTKKRRQTKLGSEKTSLSTTFVGQPVVPPKTGSALPEVVSPAPESETKADRKNKAEEFHGQEMTKTACFPQVQLSRRQMMKDVSNQNGTTVPRKSVRSNTTPLIEREPKALKSLTCGLPDRGERRGDHCPSSERKQTPARYESHQTVSPGQVVWDNREEYDDLFRGLF